MSLVNKLIDQIKGLRRSSMLRLSLLLSVIFAIGFAVAISVALILGQDAIERRVDATLTTLARTAVLEDARVASVDLHDDWLRSHIWRVLVTQDSEGTPIMVAVPLEESAQAQELIAGILWTTAAFVILLTLAIGIGAGVLAQRRLLRIDDTLGLLAAGDLSARTGQTRSKDDLDDIARQLDTTASELERLVTQTRHLSASIAHDLRTPLARLRAQLEMLPEGEERGAALEEATRLSGIFDTIMRVARIEAAQGRDGFESVPLKELGEELVEIFGPVVEDEGKQLLVDVTSPATVQADRQMLVQAMANLIQNALVHGGEEITLLVHGNALGVTDNGPGVDPNQFEEIIKPMVRLEASRTTDGSGLGLALVRAVADRHGAQLELAQNTPQGLKVILNFAKM